MHEASLHEDVEATLNRLMTKHPDLKARLDEAYGYAVFPSVGRASAVLGVGAGDGEVFEKGKSIGFANLRQLTVGVQIGGQTFSEILIFDGSEALEHFKTGPVKFNANASAVLVKAAATGTTDFGGVNAMAFGDGGELLELSLGGQKFNFQPPGAAVAKERGEEEREEGGTRLRNIASRVASKFGRHGKQKEEEQRAEEADGGEQREGQEAEDEQREAQSDQSPQPPAS